LQNPILYFLVLRKEDGNAIVAYLFREPENKEWGFAIQVDEKDDIIVTDNLNPTVEPESRSSN
jgi:predicted component of type VI protein secretion system